MTTLLHDLRFALRMMAKSPWFTTVAALSLAIGIGASTMAFGWVNCVLLHPLEGVAQDDRIVSIETVTPSGATIDSSYLDYSDFRDQATSFSGMLIFKERAVALGDDRRSDRAWAYMVSGNYFDVLGVRPAAGRFFTKDEQDATPGAHPVTVISAAMWKSRFGGDKNTIGKTIRMNRRTFTIVGVAPENFPGTIVGLSFDAFVPVSMLPELTGGNNWLEDRNNRPFHILGRLKEGVPVETARAEVRNIAQRLIEEFCAKNVAGDEAMFGEQVGVRTGAFGGKIAEAGKARGPFQLGGVIGIQVDHQGDILGLQDIQHVLQRPRVNNVVVPHQPTKLPLGELHAFQEILVTSDILGVPRGNDVG